MKTVFKVGDKVYDQINFPDKEGKVTEIERDVDGYWYVRVEFSGDEYHYNPDGSYVLNSTPTLSKSPYRVTFDGFEQKYSSTDFYDIYDRYMDVYESPDYDENYHGYPYQELADAAEALRKLLFLLDYYNDSWKPDWLHTVATSEIKYDIIVDLNNNIIAKDNYKSRNLFTFKSKEIRDKFLEEQRELLEIAKPLL